MHFWNLWVWLSQLGTIDMRKRTCDQFCSGCSRSLPQKSVFARLTANADLEGKNLPGSHSATTRSRKQNLKTRQRGQSVACVKTTIDGKPVGSLDTGRNFSTD